MKLIVGLGNPGEKYETTRHNLGFVILDHFLKDAKTVNQTNWEDSPKLKSEIFILQLQSKTGQGQKVLLAKPKTYMNGSGMAISLISSFYKITPDDIWIIHDELDLPLGAMKIRLGGSGAGHHGIESIIKALGTDKFWRFRMGIGNNKSNLKNQKSKLRIMNDFVLGGFGRGDKGSLKHMIKRGAKALTTALEKGIEASMNQFNTK